MKKPESVRTVHAKTLQTNLMIGFQQLMTTSKLEIK